MKNAFYFILKALFVLKMFNFVCLEFFVMYKKRLDWKDKLNFEIYGVTAWLTITIHILLNISRIKDNRTMKLGQLMKYNKKNISFKKSCRE